MKKLYICYTRYQLLISLIKVDMDQDNDLLCVFPFSKEKYSKIESSKLFDNVFLGTEATYSLFRGWPFISNLLTFFKKYNEIILFLDHRIIGHFLNRFKINYSLVEDGYNFYQYRFKKVPIYSNPLKEILHNIFFKPPAYPGASRFATTIEVNDKSLIDESDPRYSKMVEVPRKQLFSSLSSEKKVMLLDIFGVQPMAQAFGKSVLILTQPLYQDQWDFDKVQTSQEQFNFYNDIVESYSNEYSVYLKVHPRDTVDYSAMKDVHFLDKNVPMELYEFVGDYHFDIGITHSSTALDFLSCVDEKIFLKDLRERK